MTEKIITKKVLKWYDLNKRNLPWRKKVPSYKKPAPFHNVGPDYKGSAVFKIGSNLSRFTKCNTKYPPGINQSYTLLINCFLSSI